MQRARCSTAVTPGIHQNLSITPTFLTFCVGEHIEKQGALSFCGGLPYQTRRHERGAQSLEVGFTVTLTRTKPDGTPIYMCSSEISPDSPRVTDAPLVIEDREGGDLPPAPNRATVTLW
eukprot:SAG11_NODE_4462_length_1886_cov_2.668904_1_plen_119_part_00